MTTVTTMGLVLHIDVHSKLNLTLLWAALTRVDAPRVFGKPKLFSVQCTGPNQATVQVLQSDTWSPDKAHQELHELGYRFPSAWNKLLEEFPDLQGAPAEWEALTLLMDWLGEGSDVKLTYGRLPWPATDAMRLPVLLELCQRLGVELDLNRQAAVSALAIAMLGRFGDPTPTDGLRVTHYAQSVDDTGCPAVTIALCDQVDDETRDTVCVLSANIDDQNPEFYQYCQTRLFAAGALDVQLQPVFMKKQRPGTLLTVIGKPADQDSLVDIILAETSTLGVRRTLMERIKLQRSITKVSLPWGDVDVKLGFRAGKLTNVAPEYRDCCRLAENNQIPVKLIYQQALALFWQTWDTGDRE